MNAVTPLGAVARGAIAGVLGTAAMDLALYARYRRGGGDEAFLAWEFGGPSEWDKISAPGQVGHRLLEAFVARPIDARWARLTNNIVHWGYGIGWAAAFGVVAGSLRHRPHLLGPAFGAGVWASSYVTMPIAGLYKPMWEYGPAELAPDLAVHIVYGTVTYRAFRLLAAAQQNR